MGRSLSCLGACNGAAEFASETSDLAFGRDVWRVELDAVADGEVLGYSTNTIGFHGSAGPGRDASVLV